MGSRSGVVWVVLMAALAVPIPLTSLALPERGAPIMYLLLAAAAVILARVWSACWPLALFGVYAVGWTVAGGLQVRSIQITALIVLGGLLYVSALRMPASWSRRVGWALLVGVALELILGALNLASIFPSPTAVALGLGWIGLDPGAVFRFFNAGPWMTLLSRDYLGRPMGWLGHPNYWGAYVAFGVPVLYVLLGRVAALVGLLACALSLSIGAVASALVALGVAAWTEVPPRVRPWALVLGVAICVAVAVIHILPRLGTDDRPFVRLETVTSGRTNVWLAAWPTFTQAPVFGHGPGAWRAWSSEYNRLVKAEYATQQAHNELVQLVFEFGLVGAGLLLCWLRELRRGMSALWRAPGHKDRLWLGVLAAAGVNALGSPTFHLPVQAGVALFAAARVQGAGRRSHGA